MIFKKGKDEDAEPVQYTPTIARKQKGKTVSGSSKMKAMYKARKKANGIKQKNK